MIAIRKNDWCHRLCELHAASPDILVDAELLEGAILESGKALLGERRQAVAVAHHQAHAVVLALWVFADFVEVFACAYAEDAI